MTDSAIPSIDMASILGSPEVQAAAPATPLEEAIASVKPEDASANSTADVKFEFRSLLSPEQRKVLKKSAPAVAEKMIKDYNQIIDFGAAAYSKMNQASIALLNEQKNIRIPEADQIVNNLLRELDGYDAKYRNAKLEDFASKLKKFFGGTAYSLKSMIRDAKPIADRLVDAEGKVRAMELDLADNAVRARKLHDATLSNMDDVVAVLAALEEIADYIRGRFTGVDALLRSVGEDEQAIQFEGETYSSSELKELHADLAQAVSEVEKSWFDARQNFFIGFASAPTLRNLILVSASMQRRLAVFRTQGIPSARRSLAMWQQAALAKEGSEMGSSLQAATNKLTQDSFGAAADSVRDVAMASQAPMITEDTVFAIIDSVKAQAQALVDADKWGRDMRARNIAALERGEKEINTASVEGRRQLVANAMAAASPASIQSGPAMPEGDILAQLGVTK